MPSHSFTFSGFAGTPGITDIRETVENSVTWGKWAYNETYIINIWLDGAARDVGNTGSTTILRPGLLLAAYDSGHATKPMKWKEYDIANEGGGDQDGDNVFNGVLLYAANVQDSAGADRDTFFGWALVGGQIKSAGILIPGESDFGFTGANAGTARTAINAHGHFMLDDTWHDNLVA
jgi:hypothetical protein